MNLIEAVKSGKPFKRKDDETYYIDIYDNAFEESNYMYCEFLNECPYRSTTPLLRHDILADDWEIKE